MKLVSKTILCFICFNLVQIPLMAENSFSRFISQHLKRIDIIGNEESKQKEDDSLKQPNDVVPSPTIKKTKPMKEERIQIKKRKRSKQPNSPKAYRTPHVQDKCNYISELDEIHQVGLNISQYIDIENFKGMPKYFGGNKKADNKRDITIKAVQYFNDKGLYDPKDICKASKKYFQDLAKKAYDNGKYLLAYNYFTTAIEGEKYNKQELEDCKKHLAEKKKDFKHGDIFFFGKFEQDGNKENGPEPIEWIVLRDTGEEVILLSKYVLAHKTFDNTEEMFIWEDSTLCSWLNKEFYNEAFNEDEKRLMRKNGADWYAEEYDGDYVVIPVTNDYSDLIDNFWLRAYAVPSDKTAQDLINYDGKPFIMSKDEKGQPKWYEYSNYLKKKQPSVLTSNENIDKFSNSVYWPSGYWINAYNGHNAISKDNKCEVFYTFCDENGFFHTTKTKYNNGVRPIIKVAYKNIEKASLNQTTKREFTRSELDKIHQLGLNIFKFMDYPSYDNLPYRDKNEKREIIKSAVKYFIDMDLINPEAIYSVSKKYFQDLAEECYKNGEYKQAYKYFTTIIEGEKFDQPKLLDCKKHIANDKGKLETGDIVFFGKYEQDGNLDNGPEPIEWVVLKKDNNRLILLSKYVLTHRPIHSVAEQFKWYESELCAWLNNDFYNEAFNETEKKQMHKVGDNIWYMKEYKGDYVVLPGIEEFKGLEKYFLNTYAVPNDKKAKDFIYFDWKPFTISEDERGNISYEPESDFDFYIDGYEKQQLAITMNPNINEKSNLVYWPTRYWKNINNGGGTNCEFYCYVDENGISWGGADARKYSGIRPLISITNPDKENLK